MADFVVFETSVGEFVLELYKLHAPKTCHNFTELVRMGYYDGTIFHRVIADFVIPRHSALLSSLLSTDQLIEW